MRRVSLACLLVVSVLLVSGSFAADTQKADAPKKVVTIEGITEYHLDNGLRVLLYPDDSRPKVTVSMTVFVGSRHEGYGEAGMAHLLEHMLFKGTPTHQTIPKALQDHGAQFNGTTSLDRTNYFETLNAGDENLEFAIGLEADRLVNSLVRHEDLLSEMTVVRNEFERGENSPNNVLNQRVWAAAYEWHNYGKTTIGNRSDIERVPIASLQAFYRKYYQPDNVMVVVAGKFNEANALELIQKNFGAIPSPKRKLDQTYTREPEQDGERHVTLRRVGNVALVEVAWHIPAASHPDAAPLQVLANILDNEPSGLLYKELVQTKKASRVSTYADLAHDPGLFLADADVPETETLDAVKDKLVSLVEHVGEKGVSAEDVNRSKLQIQKLFEQRAANTQQFAISLSESAAQGDWRLYFINRDALDKVTLDEVKAVAAKYFKQSNRTVGTYIPTEKPERVLVPNAPEIEDLVKGYKGREAVSAGEAFDFTPKGIEARVERMEIVPGAKAALLVKKARGNEVFLIVNLHYGNDQNLKGLTSASQLLPPLMLKGTKQLSDQQLKDELDRLKATLTTAGGGPQGNLGGAGFAIQAKKDSLPAVIGLLKQVLREPSLPADEFEVLRRARLATFERVRTDPQALATQTLSRLLNVYPPDDVRYRPTMEELIERTKKVTLEQLKSLHTDYLGVTKAEVAIVGDFDKKACVGLLKEAFADWKPKQPYERIAMPIKSVPEATKKELDTPTKANAVFAAGELLNISDEHPDYPALVLADFILGGGSLSSRLGDRVRQKEGLSYGVGSFFNASAQDKRATLTLMAICNPQNIGKLETVIKEEWDRLLASGVTDAEVEAAKQGYLQQEQVARSNDQAVARELADLLYDDRTMAYEADLEKKIAALTAKDVNSALKKHLDSKRLVIVTAADRNAK